MVEKPAKRRYVKQEDLPRHTLEDAMRVPQAIADHFGKRATKPLSIAKSLDLTPGSVRFRTLAGAAVAYSLTDGGPRVALIGLTDLGRRAVAPKTEGDDLTAKREAFLQPRVVREFIEHYNNNKLPRRDIAVNVLEDNMGVPGDACESAFDAIVEGARSLGLLEDVKGGVWVNLEAELLTPAPEQEADAVEGDSHDDDGEDDAEGSVTPPRDEVSDPRRKRPNAIFVGHGKNKKPRDQLTKLLNEYSIPYRVAQDEPNKGRPIPIKVKETMEECGAAILIFTADEELFDKEGNSVWRPSENVVNELGAASIMYENRIIILREEDVKLATNYDSIGYIPFEKDNIPAKANDLLRELIAFGILKVSVSEE